METEVKLPKVLQKVLDEASATFAPQLVRLVKNPVIRNKIIREVEKFILGNLNSTNKAYFGNN